MEVIVMQYLIMFAIILILLIKLLHSDKEIDRP